MKSITTFALSALVLSASAHAQAGDSLRCYLSYTPMKTERILDQNVRVGAGFSPAEVLPDLSHTSSGGAFGMAIEIPLSEIQNQETATAVTKTLVSENFGGQVQLRIGYWYMGGKPTGYSVSLIHETKSGRELARAVVEGPLASKTYPVSTTLYSERKGLASVEIDCSVYPSRQ